MVFEREEIMRIEDLLKRIINKSFSEARSAIEQRIDELLEQCGATLSDEAKKILVAGYYRAAHEYANAKPRSLGGSYFLHPEQTLGVLLEAGVSDTVTLLAGLFHDAIEESNSFKKQSRKSNAAKQKRLIKKYGVILQDKLSKTFIDAGISQEKAYDTAEQVSASVVLLTKKNTETYYAYINRIFTYESPHEIKTKAIIVKFADRCANIFDLERQDYDIYRPEITFEDIIDAFSQNNTGRIQELSKKAESLGETHDQIPKSFVKFSGDQKLHPCFKNIILENRYREWSLENEANNIPEVNRMALPDATRSITYKIINHLCTYHCGNGQLSIAAVYKMYTEYQAYIALGGFKGVTRPCSGKNFEGYDGIVQRFFHPRIKGKEEALAGLFENRSMMFRAALGLRHICDMYIENPAYILRGLTYRGVHAGPPVMNRN